MAHLQKLIYDNQQLKRQISQYKQVLGVSPYVDDNLFRGGYRVVKTIEERDKIGCCHRKQGMKVVVIGEDLSYKEYVLKSENCKENIWLELDVAVREEKVLLTEDYSELEEDLLTQQDLNLVLKQIILDLNSSVENKLDKPVMTNNYYGLWDDTNKKFIDGSLRTNEDKEWLGLTVPVGSQRKKGFQVESLIPDYYNFFIGEDAGLGNSYMLNVRVKPTVQGGTSYTENTFYALGNNAQMLSERFDGTNIRRSSFAAKYIASTDSMLAHIISANDIIFSETSSGPGQIYATYSGVKGSWEFFKPVKIKDNLSFTLPATITPQPNMLVPKTDGSRPTWYNNSSVANDLAFTSDLINKLDKPNLTVNNIPYWNGNGFSDSAIFVGTGWDSSNVGIGTKDPKNRLDVRGGSISIQQNNAILLNGEDRHQGLMYKSILNGGIPFDGSFLFGRKGVTIGFYDDTEYYTLNVIGHNVGIGTISPTEKLEVNGNAKANAYKFNLQSSITPTPNTLVAKTDGSGLTWYNNNSVAGELFTGTPFVYNVPSTITVNHVNAPASPDVPSYVQEIQDRLTQLNQPGVVMQKFTNWNVVTANNVTNSNIGVINNNLIKTFISAFNSETSISAQSSIISISTNKVLPADKDWVVMFSTNLGHDGESYSNGGVKFVMKRYIGLFSGDTSGFVPPEVYIFDAGAEWSRSNIIKLQSGKICSGASGTSTNGTINTNDESANVQVTMLKAGNHILVQIYYAGYAISDIYSSTILSGDAGFSVLCKKPTSGGNGYVGEVSNVRYYIFP